MAIPQMVIALDERCVCAVAGRGERRSHACGPASDNGGLRLSSGATHRHDQGCGSVISVVQAAVQIALTEPFSGLSELEAKQDLHLQFQSRRDLPCSLSNRLKRKEPCRRLQDGTDRAAAVQKINFSAN